ncbi:DUF1472 domain-containing protein [Escherichia coli]|nr:DUF1472 domain-containing protein [Escherichia coli]EEU4111739.1 DUF1472 domain-containing protein [Escherichia coli]EEY2075251.1 DUF1472 domain-containing protein [Escherichia coli]EFH0138404.1 DUF1472 domain-containing protein [Escherichia coli]EFI9394746.1 DUF1472 domain-containing protein [Escherichia coli]
MRRVLCTRRNKEVAGGSAFTRPCGAWPCGFSALWPQRRVRAVCSGQVILATVLQ